MFVNFSSSALSRHTVEGFENNRNICEKLMYKTIYKTILIVSDYWENILKHNSIWENT